jgi:hypothetical protein
MLEMSGIAPLESTCDLDIGTFINTIKTTKNQNDTMKRLNDYIQCSERPAMDSDNDKVIFNEKITIRMSFFVNNIKLT